MRNKVQIANASPWEKHQDRASLNAYKARWHTMNREVPALVRVLAEDFAAHGKDAVAALREKSPDKYIRLYEALCLVPDALALEAVPVEDAADKAAEAAALAARIEAKRALLGKPERGDE